MMNILLNINGSHAINYSYRRCKMDPLWNTLIVAGVEEEEKNNKETSTPFIGVITQKVCFIVVRIYLFSSRG